MQRLFIPSGTFLVSPRSFPGKSIPMSSTRSGANYRADSPDPASHAPNVYDDPNWDENDDDIDYEPPTETESADLEFFDTAFGDDSDDDDEGSEFHGM